MESAMSDIITELGSLAFASRLRRLSDRLMRDVARIYGELAVNFEPRWFPLLYLLHRQPVMSVTDAARALGLTHPAVNQIAGAMMRVGLLAAAKDRSDERRRMLRLTRKGEKIHAELTAVWKEIEAANRELLEESGADILGLLAAIEHLLDRRDMYARIHARLSAARPAAATIIDYSPAHRKRFAALNLEWLEEYFSVTELDRAMLSDPEKHILKPGGFIFFARTGRSIVGTCALIKRDRRTFELTKMAVSRKLRGRGIGRQLAEHAIAVARHENAKTIVLGTSQKLAAAVSLYNSLGFVDAPPSNRGDCSDCRCTIHMRLDLSSSGTQR
jgi:GNAT superfamily N-acetyltransferase/DNA-binding MarR family transcriptional regulator